MFRKPSVLIPLGLRTFFLSVHKLSASLKLSGIYAEDSGCPEDVPTTTWTRCWRCKEIHFLVQILLSIKISMRKNCVSRRLRIRRTTMRSHVEHSEALPNIKFVIRMLSVYCPSPSGRLVLWKITAFKGKCMFCAIWSWTTLSTKASCVVT